MEKAYPVPEAYNDAVSGAVRLFALMNDSKFKGYITVTVRPAGSRMIISDEIYCMDCDRQSHWRLFDFFCSMLVKAKKAFGEKNFIFEITNRRGDSLEQIRVNASKKVKTVIEAVFPADLATPEKGDSESPPDSVPESGLIPASQRKSKPEPELATEPRIESKLILVPKTAPKPANDSEPASTFQNKPKPRPKPKPGTATKIVANGTADLSEHSGLDTPIDFESMRYFPTEATFRNIRKVFGICGIATKGDLLEALGTAEPTRLEWETFIKKLGRKASLNKAKLWPSSDGTLYWWLVKKVKWIKPFSVDGNKRR